MSNDCCTAYSSLAPVGAVGAIHVNFAAVVLVNAAVNPVGAAGAAGADRSAVTKDEAAELAVKPAKAFCAATVIL